MPSQNARLFAPRLGRLPTPLVVIVFVICSALPLALLTTFSITFGENGLRHEVNERLDGVAVASAQSLDKQTAGLGDLVQSYADRSEIVGPLETLETKPGDPSATTALGNQLNKLLAARNEISVTFLTDTQGHLLAGRPNSPANVGVDYSYRDWYRGVTATGSTYVSDAFESAAPGQPAVVAIATPIHDANGNVIGYIGANYGLKAIQSFVGDFASSQGVQLTVTDRHGTVVAAPGILPPGLTSDENDVRVKAALAGANGVRSWDANGQRFVSSYAPVKTLGWAVVANTPANKAFAPVSRLRTAVLISAGVLGLVLMAGLTFLGLNLRDRARVERRSQEQSQETRSILEASADAYIAMDEQGQIIAWSKQAENTFGWTADEAIGHSVNETVVPARYRNSFQELLEQNLVTDNRFLNTRLEAIASNKADEEFPIELVVWATRSAERTVFSAFCHDITERNEAATELESARDRAMEASRLKSQFVANMSHEIRTPMNGIIGMVDLLRRTELSTEQRTYADTVWRSAEALLDVINDILDFSKIEAGRLELADIPFDPHAVIEEAGELLAGAAQAKGLEFAVMIDSDVPDEVRGDPGRLRQIILNLVGNAVKFTTEGEVVVRCKVEDLSERQIFLRFEVADTGCGIADRDLGRLFESFSQVDPSSTRRHGGTGLGLAISKRLAELMAGEIGVDSQESVGSTFWFTAQFELPSIRQGSHHQKRRTKQAVLAEARALVVDDNATNRMILERMLQSWGMWVDLVSNAADAMTKLRAAAEENAPFVIALLDYNMPEIDGLELAQQISNDDQLKSTSRLLLTSSAERGEVSAIQDGRVYGYLTKPVRESSLLSLVIEAIEAANSEVRNARDGNDKPTQSHLLVVDDNLVNQHVMRVMLEKMDYLVDVVSDGQQALDAIFTSIKSYDAVLMDCQMPVLDGYETTRELRRREPSGVHTPVIAITAHAMEGDVEKCFGAGMDDYLAKPVLWDDLQAILEKHLEHASK